MATRSSTPGAGVAAKAPARAAAANRASPVIAKALPSKAVVPAESDATKPRHKLVRDSFTIPKNEYTVLVELKLRAARLARPAKKSEILRAGIGALNAMPDAAFLSALGSVPSLKTGRPKQVKATADKAPTKNA